MQVVQVARLFAEVDAVQPFVKEGVVVLDELPDQLGRHLGLGQLSSRAIRT